MQPVLSKHWSPNAEYYYILSSVLGLWGYLYIIQAGSILINLIEEVS